MDRFMNEMSKMLAELKEKQKNANNQLMKLPHGSISTVKRGNAICFFHMQCVEGRRVRKSINKNPEMIKALARKKYLHRELNLISDNIAVIEKAIHQYESCSTDDVLEKIPEAIRNYCFDTDPAGWGKEPYEKSDHMPEKKLHTTSRGLKVRSKSEVLIAEKLYEHHVQFRYEQVLRLGEIRLVPDFTVLADDGRIIYWEHCGMTGSEEYMKRHKWKTELYEKADIVPWKNLIITYDDEYGNISMNIVESEIKCKIKVGFYDAG